MNSSTASLSDTSSDFMRLLTQTGVTLKQRRHAQIKFLLRCDFMAAHLYPRNQNLRYYADQIASFLQHECFEADASISESDLTRFIVSGSAIHVARNDNGTCISKKLNSFSSFVLPKQNTIQQMTSIVVGSDSQLHTMSLPTNVLHAVFYEPLASRKSFIIRCISETLPLLPKKEIEEKIEPTFSEHSYRPGEMIFKSGEPISQFFVLREGSCVMSSAGEDARVQIESETFFGHEDIALSQRITSCIATRAAVVYAVDKRVFIDNASTRNLLFASALSMVRQNAGKSMQDQQSAQIKKLRTHGSVDEYHQCSRMGTQSSQIYSGRGTLRSLHVSDQQQLKKGSGQHCWSPMKQKRGAEGDKQQVSMQQQSRSMMVLEKQQADSEIGRRNEKVRHLNMHQQSSGLDSVRRLKLSADVISMRPTPISKFFSEKHESSLPDQLEEIERKVLNAAILPVKMQAGESSDDDDDFDKGRNSSRYTTGSSPLGKSRAYLNSKVNSQGKRSSLAHLGKKEVRFEQESTVKVDDTLQSVRQNTHSEWTPTSRSSLTELPSIIMKPCERESFSSMVLSVPKKQKAKQNAIEKQQTSLIMKIFSPRRSQGPSLLNP